jgi:hypothetical protein
MGFGLGHRATRRILASLAAGLFAFVLASRGLCPMSPSADASIDPHACCRTGLQPTAPACCLDAPSADIPAREAPPAAATVPSSPFVAAQPIPPDTFAVAGRETSPPGPSPPGTYFVIRI